MEHKYTVLLDRKGGLHIVDKKILEDIGRPCTYEAYVVEVVSKGLVHLKLMSEEIERKFDECMDLLEVTKREFEEARRMRMYAIINETVLYDDCHDEKGEACPFFEWYVGTDDMDNDETHVACRHMNNEIRYDVKLDRPIEEYFTPKGQDDLEHIMRIKGRQHISPTCPYKVVKG